MLSFNPPPLAPLLRQRQCLLCETLQAQAHPKLAMAVAEKTKGPPWRLFWVLLTSGSLRSLLVSDEGGGFSPPPPGSLPVSIPKALPWKAWKSPTSSLDPRHSGFLGLVPPSPGRHKGPSLALRLQEAG